MDQWEQIRATARDSRGGATAVTTKAARLIRNLETRRDILRAARLLLRRQATNASLRHMLSTALNGGGDAVDAWIAQRDADSIAAADGARWLVKRRTVVLTHSSSQLVARACERVEDRIARAIITASLPGGEGRTAARRLKSLGLKAEIIADSQIAAHMNDVTIVLMGGSAVTPAGVIDKVGAFPIAVVARHYGVPVYAIATEADLIEQDLVRVNAGMEATPLELFAGVLTERGVLAPASVRRAIGRVRIDEAIRKIV